MHQETIEIKGKKYQLKKDVDYIDAKKFTITYDKCKAKDYQFPNENLLKVLIPAICPTIKMNFEEMSIDGKRLSFSEVLNLVQKLTDILNTIINESLDEIGMKQSIDEGLIQQKNGEPATEVVTSIA